MSSEPVTPNIDRDVFASLVKVLPAPATNSELLSGGVPHRPIQDPASTGTQSRRKRPGRPGIALVCSHCDLITHVETAVLDRNERCDYCGEALFGGRVADLHAANFDLHVNASHIPTAVVFWAPWCAPCNSVLALVQRAAQEFEPRIRFARVNTDVERALVVRHAVRGIPTVLLFRNGKETVRRIGSVDMRSIADWAHS